MGPKRGQVDQNNIQGTSLSSNKHTLSKERGKSLIPQEIGWPEECHPPILNINNNPELDIIFENFGPIPRDIDKKHFVGSFIDDFMDRFKSLPQNCYLKSGYNQKYLPLEDLPVMHYKDYVFPIDESSGKRIGCIEVTRHMRKLICCLLITKTEILKKLSSTSTPEDFPSFHEKLKHWVMQEIFSPPI
jgi:hypothetical protein